MTSPAYWNCGDTDASYCAGSRFGTPFSPIDIEFPRYEPASDRHVYKWFLEDGSHVAYCDVHHLQYMREFAYKRLEDILEKRGDHWPF